MREITCTDQLSPTHSTGIHLTNVAGSVKYTERTDSGWCVPCSQLTILQVLAKFRLPLALSPGPSQPRRGLVHTVCACAKYPQFVGEIHKIAYTYRTLVTYTNRACSFHANKGEHDCQKAISCTVSVVKADRVQGGAATNREISISVAALW